jgi:DNA-binding XRE family transcriptional regulator
LSFSFPLAPRSADRSAARRERLSPNSWVGTTNGVTHALRAGHLPPTMDVPADYARRLRCIRRQLGLTQQQLAAKIRAARKAVVYQWESGKRRPSPVFWQRIQDLSSRRPVGKPFGNLSGQIRGVPDYGNRDRAGHGNLEAFTRRIALHRAAPCRGGDHAVDNVIGDPRRSIEETASLAAIRAAI